MPNVKLAAWPLAVVVTGLLGVATPPASGIVFTITTTACSGGTNVAFCYENAAKEKLELTGEQSETDAGGKAVFTIETEPAQKIECTESTGSGTFFQKEPLVAGKKTTLKGTLTFKGCKLITEPSKKCIIQVEDTTKELEGTLETESTLALKPASGTVFMEIEYANNGAEKCPATFLGKHAVTGNEQLTINDPAPCENTKSVSFTFSRTLSFLSAVLKITDVFTISWTGFGDPWCVAKVA